MNSVEKIRLGKMHPTDWKVYNMLLGNSGGQLLIAPERVKWLGQSGNDAQLCMYLVVKINSDAVKNNVA